VDVLGGNAVTNGWLTSARGAGSVIGALLLASLAHRGGKGKLLALSTFVFPVALLGFAFIHWLPLAMVMLAVMGLAIILMLNAANALVQSLVPEALRGRVMSIYSLVFFGAMPIGALLIGWGAQIIGNQMAVIVDALLTMVIAILVWFFVPRMRQMD
jgi:MFS family permease